MCIYNRGQLEIDNRKSISVNLLVFAFFVVRLDANTVSIESVTMLDESV